MSKRHLTGQLLEVGGWGAFRTHRDYDVTLWRPALRFAFPGSTLIRADVHAAWCTRGVAEVVRKSLTDRSCLRGARPGCGGFVREHAPMPHG